MKSTLYSNLRWINIPFQITTFASIQRLFTEIMDLLRFLILTAIRRIFYGFLNYLSRTISAFRWQKNQSAS